MVEKGYRGRGIGSNLLNKLEKKISKLGIKFIWTWTAGFEAENFYKKMGYSVMAIQKAYYSNGTSRIALMKQLSE